MTGMLKKPRPIYLLTVTVPLRDASEDQQLDVVCKRSAQKIAGETRREKTPVFRWLNL